MLVQAAGVVVAGRGGFVFAPVKAAEKPITVLKDAAPDSGLDEAALSLFGARGAKENED